MEEKIIIESTHSKKINVIFESEKSISARKFQDERT